MARNYALIPPALCLLAAWYPVRLRNPWGYGAALFLLVHSHAYMEGLAGILGVLFAWDWIRHRRRMKGFAAVKTAGILLLMAVGVAAAFLQVAPAFGTSSFAPASVGTIFHHWSAVPEKILTVLQRLPADFAPGLVRLAGRESTLICFYAALLTGMIGLFRNGTRTGIIFTVGFLWQILFAALLYPIALHRVYLPYLMLIFGFALPVRKSKPHSPCPGRSGGNGAAEPFRWFF